MSAVFSEQVSSPSWRIEAHDWIDRQVRDRGWRVTGEIDQVRVRPWSTQLIAPTTVGRVWFKAGAPSSAFEGALQAELARLVPGAVQAPLAIDAERGWMLSAEHAAPLGESAPPSTDDWAQLLAEAARIQQALLPHGDRLRALGLPDRTPRHVPDLFDALRRRMGAWPDRHPGRLSPDDDRRLDEVRPRIREAGDRLASSPVPDTWNHGDLHPHNAYRDGDGIRLFDLGDGAWAGALEILAVPGAWLADDDDDEEVSDVDWESVVEAYVRAWGRPFDIEGLWDDVRLVHAVNRAHAWSLWVDDVDDSNLERWGDAPKQHLLSVFDVLGAR